MPDTSRAAPLPHNHSQPEALRAWLVAVRPFSFPASVLPFIVGTVSAFWNIRCFEFRYALLGLVGVVLLHAGTNVLNDVMDWRLGVDRTPNPSSGAIVRGWISPSEALRTARLLIGAALCIGLILAVWVGPAVLVPAALGLASGIAYNVPPLRWKRTPAGDVLVVITFGVLIPLGAWVLQTGSLAFAPVLAGLPPALLILAILHANNLRDRTADAARGYRTLAVALGPRRGVDFYVALVASGCLACIIPVAKGVMPAGALAGWLAVIPAARVLWTLRSGAAETTIPKVPPDLDVRTAQLCLVLGALYAGGAIVHTVLAL